MKLSKIYSNKPRVFEDIRFNSGLNVILGEIRLPENRNKDTHNLGKTTLAGVLDFCLLRSRDPEFFLFRHLDRFEEFVFYIEIETGPETFVTVRRPVDGHTRISFGKHTQPDMDLRTSAEDDWDHWDMAFESAKTLLDGLLDLRAIAPWGFRSAVSYSLRGQGDFDEPFKLSKYSGKHSAWKPFLGHVLGLDADIIKRSFSLADEVKKKGDEAAILRAELSGVADDTDQLRGLIEIKQREVETVGGKLDVYDFELSDSEINRELVEELDEALAELNERRYHLSSAMDRIKKALASGVAFDLKRIEKIFGQAGVYFNDQLKKDYKDLVAFNREISEERDSYLKTERTETEVELRDIAKELRDLNAKRSSALVHLRDKDTFSKFRQLSEKVVELRTDLEVLARQEESVERLQDLSNKVTELEAERDVAVEAIKKDLKNPSDTYKAIRKLFDATVMKVIGKHANLYTRVNKDGNVEFRVGIVDGRGRETGAAEGHTYRRLLCVAFDMAIQLSHVKEPYPHFLYHDGALESLDDRPKLNLLDEIKKAVAEGVQYFLTVIDSELPPTEDSGELFEEGDVVLRLHDDGIQGRLFKMAPW